MKARYLTPGEVEALFSVMPLERRLVFEVALQSGLRIGDVLKIRRSDLRRTDPDEVEIRFVAEKTKKKGKAYVHGAVAEHLFGLRRGRKGFLWPSNAKCGHVTRQTVWNWAKEAGKAANIDLRGLSPHSLRKCFAVKLRHEKGIDAAQRALQHSHSAQTAIYAYADVYAGADPNAPVLWCQVDELLDLITERLKQKKTS